MNYDEMAREICAWSLDYVLEHDEITEEALAAKLEELFPIPKGLEAAISQAFVDTDICMGEVGYVEDVSGRITDAVAPFCQKPEVPESLAAAVAKGFITFKGEVPIDDGYDCGDLIASVVSAVAPLLAEGDKEIKELEADINPSKRVKEIIGELNDLLLAKDKRIEELEEQLASLRLQISDTLRRLEQADLTTMWWAGKNNIRNCLIRLQRTAALR